MYFSLTVVIITCMVMEYFFHYHRDYYEQDPFMVAYPILFGLAVDLGQWIGLRFLMCTIYGLLCCGHIVVYALDLL